MTWFFGWHYREKPSNYPGVILSNYLSKLFNKVLYNRLKHNLENKNISKAQIRFRKKYVKNGKYLCYCFVDMACDSFCREGLRFKLEKVRTKRKFLNINISFVYTSLRVSLIYKTQVTKSFATVGLKQGGILSTIKETWNRRNTICKICY